jgi:hypothetical protein
MNRPLILAAAVALAGVTACVPPQVDAVRLVRINNTPADIAWCNSHPGGVPEWDPQELGQLNCRIVP